MDLKDWKRIAEREACRYRERKAFLRGAQEGGGPVETERVAEAARWTAAVEYADAHLSRQDAEKARFFRELYGIDRPTGRYRGKKSVDALSLKLHVAPCTVPGANSAVYRNLGMRLVRIAALILIGGQGMLLMLTGMLSEDVDKWAFYLIDAIPLTLVFLTVFLLPVFTKRYERDFSHLGPMDCAEEMGV